MLRVFARSFASKVKINHVNHKTFLAEYQRHFLVPALEVPHTTKWDDLVRDAIGSKQRLISDSFALGTGDKTIISLMQESAAVSSGLFAKTIYAVGFSGTFTKLDWRFFDDCFRSVLPAMTGVELAFICSALRYSHKKELSEEFHQAVADKLVQHFDEMTQWQVLNVLIMLNNSGYNTQTRVEINESAVSFYLTMAAKLPALLPFFSYQQIAKLLSIFANNRVAEETFLEAACSNLGPLLPESPNFVHITDLRNTLSYLLTLDYSPNGLLDILLQLFIQKLTPSERDSHEFVSYADTFVHTAWLLTLSGRVHVAFNSLFRYWFIQHIDAKQFTSYVNIQYLYELLVEVHPEVYPWEEPAVAESLPADLEEVLADNRLAKELKTRLGLRRLTNRLKEELGEERVELTYLLPRWTIPDIVITTSASSPLALQPLKASHYLIHPRDALTGYAASKLALLSKRGYDVQILPHDLRDFVRSKTGPLVEIEEPSFQLGSELVDRLLGLEYREGVESLETDEVDTVLLETDSGDSPPDYEVESPTVQHVSSDTAYGVEHVDDISYKSTTL